MSIYLGKNKLSLFKGNRFFASLYKGSRKIAGGTTKTFSGSSVIMDKTYNGTFPESITVCGEFTEGKNLFDLSSVSLVSGRKTNILLSGGTTYTVSFNFLGSGICTQTLMLGTEENNSLFVINPNAENGLYSFTVTPKNDAALTVSYGGEPLPAQFNAIFFKYTESFQIEKGSAATAYEAYKPPTYPILNWNGEEITIPYALFKSRGDKIVAKNREVTLYADETVDISETDAGKKLLSLKTAPGRTAVSISNATLFLRVLTSD